MLTRKLQAGEFYLWSYFFPGRGGTLVALFYSMTFWNCYDFFNTTYLPRSDLVLGGKMKYIGMANKLKHTN